MSFDDSNDFKTYDQPPLKTDTNKVSREEMIRYMFKILEEYDRSMSIGHDPEINPMSGRISMQLNDNTSIDIPENVQRYAISLYVDMKKNKNSNETVFNTIEDDTKSVLDQIIKNKKMILTIFVVILVCITLYILYQRCGEIDL